ncbi:MAG TPA: protease pro-enzyme activation domain-containing protein, partial [Bryobacteraceae bacterium]|nr:protease pro-enzyme activation domain-containing protein [Bryobacteraceae bacterium]
MKTVSRWVPLAFAVMASALLCSGAEDRVAGKVDPAVVRPLRGYVHPGIQAATDLGPLDSATLIPQGMLLLKPAAGLDEFLADQQSPGSPNYHKWLTPEQYSERFGASSNDTAKIVAWLESQGLRVTTVARGRQWVSFTGSAAAAGRAFRTEFRQYRSGGRVRFANSREPSVPLALDRVVAGVHGFNNFGLKPLHRQSAVAPNFNTSSGNHYLAPGDIATIFNIAPLYAAGIDGKGQSVAIVGQTEVNLEDIRAFRKRFSLPANDPEIQLFGPSPGSVPGDLEEAALDLEWSGAVAPNAHIIYVNSQDVIGSVYYAIDNSIAPVISMSYGGCEAENTPDLRILGQQANAQGITWVVSSGDAGAAGCDFSSPTPQATKGRVAEFPSTLPEVTSIGGTTLREGDGNYWATTNKPDNSSALSYIPEVAWNDSAARNELAATGGGASVFYPKPFWQNAP